MKKTILASAFALTLLGTSCLGPNNAQNKVNNWNAEVTEHNWLNEILFIIPLGFVQQLAWLGDVIIFNTIEYWGGENPVSDPGDFPESFSNG